MHINSLVTRQCQVLDGICWIICALFIPITLNYFVKTKIEKRTPFKRSITKSIKQTSKFTEANAESRTKTNQLHA